MRHGLLVVMIAASTVSGVCGLNLPRFSTRPRAGKYFSTFHNTGGRYASNDWLTTALTIPESIVLRRIAFHLLSNIGWTAGILGLRARGLIPWSLNPLIHTLLGGFLSLLLVFRTSTAYDVCPYRAEPTMTRNSSRCQWLSLASCAHQRLSR